MVIVTKNKLNNVSLNKTIIIDACVELIANNGRPLTLLDDSLILLFYNVDTEMY